MNSLIHHKHFSWILFVVVLGLYLLTLTGGVGGGDSGEFTALAYTWGVAHPPGFPLYSLLVNLFSFLPIGSGVFRVNLFSAIWGAAGALFLFKAVQIKFESAEKALLVALVYAASPLTWEYSLVAEVFSFNGFFVCGLFYFAFKFEKERTPLSAYLVAFWSTLGLSNHHIFLFISLPYFLRMAWLLLKNNEAPLLFRCCLVAGLGFIPYFYLPMAQSFSPLVSWGSVDNWNGFWHHFLRKDYGTLRLVGTNVIKPDGDYNTIYFYLKTLFENYYYIGFPLAIFAIYKNFKDSWIKWASFVFVGYLLIFASLSNFDLRVPVHQVMQLRFVQQTEAFWSLAAVLGAFAILEKQKWKFKNQLIYILVALFVAVGFWKNLELKTDVNQLFAEAVLRDLPKNSLLLTQGDHTTNPVQALQLANGYRQDVKVLDMVLLQYKWYSQSKKQQFPEIVFPGTHRRSKNTGYTLQSFVRKNLEKGLDVFICDGFKILEKEMYEMFEFIPFGLSQKVVFKGQNLSGLGWTGISEKVFSEMLSLNWKIYGEQSWEFISFAHILEGVHYLGANQLIQGQRVNSSSLVKRGIKNLELFLEHTYYDKPTAYKNLGIGYQFLSKREPSLKEKMISNYEKYLSLASPEGKQYKAIKNTLERINRAGQ